MPKRTDRGFTSLELLVVLIIVATIVLVGVFILNHGKKAGTGNSRQTTTQQTTKSSTNATNNPFPSGKSYSNDYVSFYYPSGWTVTGCPDDTSPGCVTVSGTTDPDIPLLAPSTATATHYDIQRLVITIAPAGSPPGGSRDCGTQSGTASSCQVYDIQQLTNAALSGARLVISDFNSTGYPVVLNVSDDNGARLNSTDYWSGAVVKGKLRLITANVNYDVNPTTPYGWIANVPTFKATNSYINFVKILNTLTFKK